MRQAVPMADGERGDDGEWKSFPMDPETLAANLAMCTPLLDRINGLIPSTPILILPGLQFDIGSVLRGFRMKILRTTIGTSDLTKSKIDYKAIAEADLKHVQAYLEAKIYGELWAAHRRSDVDDREVQHPLQSEGGQGAPWNDRGPDERQGGAPGEAGSH